MRNDTHDEPEQVPSLSAEPRRSAPAEPLPAAAPVESRLRPGQALLWVLSLASLIALGSLALWSGQQISRLEAQLVATQDSFARISEEAAGRIQVISGQVVAAESSVINDSEALKLRIRQHEAQLAEQLRDQQALNGSLQALLRQHERLTEDLEQLQATQRQQHTRQVADQQALSGQQAALLALEARLQGGEQAQAEQLASVQKGLNQLQARLQKADPEAGLRQLQDDLLMLRSALEQRSAEPATTAAGQVEFDAFRAQTSRQIITLQSQLQQLQQQLQARP